MKQRITHEQLSELTEEQEKKLNRWWRDEGFRVYDIAYDKDIAQNNTPVINVCNQEMIELSINALPLLGIGQMIELLQEKHPAMEFDRNFYVDLEYKWDVEGHEAIELCDALWQAMKEVL